MPYQLNWTSDTVVFEFSGTVTSRDILASNQEVYGDPRFDHLRWQLVFFDGVTEVEFTHKDVKKIAYLDWAAAKSNSRITVVFVGDSSLLVDLFEVYHSYVKEDVWPTYHSPSREDAFAYVAENAG